MKAVVLVGGQGTRLRPLTLTTPKQMLPLVGRPMIERVVSHIGSYGVDEVVLSLGYKPDAFIAAYPDGHCANVKLRYAVENEPLDTAGAIAFAAAEAGIDDTFIAVNGDVITDLDLASLVTFHRNCGGAATIALTPVEDPSAFGVVVVDGDSRVQDFVEKPAPGEAPTNTINAGTYVLEPSVLDMIPAGRKVSIERETFPSLVASGLLYARVSDASWVDAGTPPKFIEANLALAQKLGVCQSGEVLVDASAQVVNSVLGDGVVIEAGARVEGSVLFEGARVGAGARVQDSIVGKAAVIGARATVTQLCVLGDHAVIAPDGAITAQLVSPSA